MLPSQAAPGPQSCYKLADLTKTQEPCLSRCKRLNTGLA